MATLTVPTPDRPTRGWRLMLTVVLAAACGDATGGILASGTTTPLATTLPVHTTVLAGTALFAVAVTGQLAARHAVRTGQTRPLRVCLSLLVIWYATCATALVAACLRYGHPVDAPVLAVSVLLAVAACAAARTAAGQIGR